MKAQPKKGSNKDPHRYQKPLKPVKKNRYSDFLGLIIIILLGITIYSNSFNCSFHFDDSIRIVDNARIRNLADVKAWWNSYPMRPVGMFTFALNYHFNRLDVRYYHLVNLIIHLINACLAGWLALLIFSSPALKDNPIVKHKKLAALLIALLFVSHPLATQSVTYIVQRMASMVAMFYLLSLILYAKARLSNKGNRSKTLLFTASLISAVLAMLTKENAFTLPFAILLFEFFFLRTKKITINFRDYRVILLITALLGIIITVPLIFSFRIFRPIPPALGNAYTITSFNYLFTQFSVIIKYIQLLLLPVNQNLDYDFPISNNFFGISTLISFLVLLALIILAVLAFKKYRIISFGIFWFFLTLSIESSFIPIADVIFEHRTYLPSFGFFMILTSGIYLLLWNKHKYLAISIFVIIIGSNSWLTYERNKVWKNDLTLWSDNISKSPNKARPIASLGDYYKNHGQWDKAITCESKAIEINPKFIDAYDNRGVAYANLSQWDKAISDESRAIGIDPEYRDAYNNRGGVYSHLGLWNKALVDYSKVIEIDPEFAQAYNNRGIVYVDLGQYDKAIIDFSRVIRIDPEYNEAYYNRGVAFDALGQYINSIADYSSAIEFNPDHAKAYVNRAVAYGNLGQWNKAIADYSKAIEIEPENSITYYNRGVAYGNLGQWESAIADYSKSLEINPNNTNAYNNHEIAYKKLHSEKK